MLRLLVSALGLFALWLLLSGVYKPLVVWLGAGSAVAATLMVTRMDRLDGYRLAFILNPLRIFGYLFWLFSEIAKSNIAVARVILSGGATMRQNLFSVKNSQKTEIGAVVFANSITLTPGTLTVDIDKSCFWVHALSYCERDMETLVDMDARVTALEMR